MQQCKGGTDFSLCKFLNLPMTLFRFTVLLFRNRWQNDFRRSGSVLQPTAVCWEARKRHKSTSPRLSLWAMLRYAPKPGIPQLAVVEPNSLGGQVLRVPLSRPALSVRVGLPESEPTGSPSCAALHGWPPLAVLYREQDRWFPFVCN